MQQKKSSGYGLLAFPVIKAASNGDTEAIRMVLKHYEAYIYICLCDGSMMKMACQDVM